MTFNDQAKALFQDQVFATKSSFQSLGSESPLPRPGLYYKIFISELALWKPSSRTRALLQNLHFRAWALEALFQDQGFATKSSLQSLGSGSPLPGPGLYYKIFIFGSPLPGPGLYYKIFISELGLWKPSSRTRSLLQNLHFRAWAQEALFQDQVFTTKSSFQSLGSGSQDQVFTTKSSCLEALFQDQVLTTKSSFQSLGSGSPLPGSGVYYKIFISELWPQGALLQDQFFTTKSSLQSLGSSRTRSLLQNLHFRAWALEALFQD